MHTLLLVSMDRKIPQQGLYPLLQKVIVFRGLEGDKMSEFVKISITYFDYDSSSDGLQNKQLTKLILLLKLLPAQLKDA